MCECAAGFGLRHALDTMGAGFEFQAAKTPAPGDLHAGFAIPAQARLADAQHVDAPAMVLGIRV